MPKIKIDLDASSATQSIKKYNDEERKTAGIYKASTAASKKLTVEQKKGVAVIKKSAREHKSLERFAVRANNAAEGSAGKYRRAMERVNEVVDAGIEKKEWAIKQEKRLAKQYLKTGKDGVKGQGLVATAFQSATSMINAQTVAMAAVGGVIQIVRKETEQLQEMANRAQATQMTASQAENAASRNMGGATNKEKDLMSAAVRQISKKNQIPLTQAFQAMAGATSRAEGDVTLAIPALGFASQVYHDDPDKLIDFTNALTNMAMSTGSRDMAFNAGLFNRLGELSQITDPAKQAKMLPKAMASGQALGASRSFIGSVYPAITIHSKDQDGATSFSGLLKLIDKMGDYSFADGKKLSPTKRLEHLMANPGEAREFFDENQWEAVYKGQIKALLTDSSSAMANSVKKNLALDWTDETLRARGKRSTYFKNNPLDSSEATHKSLREGARSAKLDHRTNIATDEDLKNYGDIATASGMTWTEQSVDNMFDRWVFGGRTQTQLLKRAKDRHYLMFETGVREGGLDEIKSSAGYKGLGLFIKDYEEKLNTQSKDQKDQLQATRENTDAVKELIEYHAKQKDGKALEEIADQNKHNPRVMQGAPK